MSEHDQVRIEPPDFDVSRTLTEIADVIESRKGADPDKEESCEVVMAAKDKSPKDIIYETADLWFHTLVMLSHYGLRPETVLAELHRREGLSGLEEKRRRNQTQTTVEK